MPETMTHYERMRAVWNCEKPDRVPYMPMTVYFVARQGGLTINEFFTQPEKFLQACLWTASTSSATPSIPASTPPTTCRCSATPAGT